MLISDLDTFDHFCFKRDLERFGVENTPIFVLNKNTGHLTQANRCFERRAISDYLKDEVVKVKATFELIKEKNRYIFLDETDIVNIGDEYTETGLEWYVIRNDAYHGRTFTQAREMGINGGAKFTAIRRKVTS